MTRDAGWVRLSTALAPVLLVGGWTIADLLQRNGFDPVEGTISALAALDADHRWVMTGALVGVGLCHLASAAGLRTAAMPGRVVLAVGGAATIGVAATPLPAGGGGSAAHAVTAAVAFGALAIWPAVAVRRGPGGTPPAWRPVVGVGAAVVLAALVGWFAVELGGPRAGLAERVAAAAQACWPAVAVRLGRRDVG